MKAILKIVFAASIILWLVENERLDFSLIPRALKHNSFWMVLGLILFQGLLAALRWRVILHARSQGKLGLFSIVRISWIGLFFNNFLPGAVTGDLIKLIYTQGLDRNLGKTFLVTSVFMDRIFGLTGLLCIMGVSSLLYFDDISAIGPQVRQLMLFNLFLFAGALLFVASLFTPSQWQEKLSRLANKLPFLGQVISKVSTQIWAIGKNKGVVIKSLTLSLGAQLICCSSFYLLGRPFFPVDIPLGHILSIIPLGLITVAIPIAPAGIGLGHVAFEQLFGLINIPGGANYFNLYFLCQAMVNLLGVFPYIFNRKPLGKN